MRFTTDRLANIALIAALVFASFATYRNVAQRTPSIASKVERYGSEKNWREIAAAATPLHGDAGAPVVVTLFSDYQCPACAYLHQQVDALRKQSDTTGFRLVLRHFPLSDIHPAARSAAAALECAARDGKAARMDSVLFARSDELGTKPWRAFAEAAGVVDPIRFDTCMVAAEINARINDDIATGKRLSLIGTPTVFVNGTRVNGAVSAVELDSLIRRVTER